MTRAFRPATLDEALRILGDAELGAVAVAGCTDLLVVDNATHREHAAVVDLLRLDELKGIHRDGDWIDVGAASTFHEIRHDPLVRAHAPILAEAAATIGGWQIQNRATIGGNVANASPVGDSLPVLLALDAEVCVHGSAGERSVPYERMHTGYRKTALEPGELIARIRVPIESPAGVQAFKKVGTRAAQAISKVVCAFRARCVTGVPLASGSAGTGEVLTDVRFAAGSVAETPVRLRGTESFCEGRSANEETAARAARIARSEVTPIDDVRSTALYRSFVLGRVVRRMILDAGAGDRSRPESSPAS